MFISILDELDQPRGFNKINDDGIMVVSKLIALLIRHVHDEEIFWKLLVMRGYLTMFKSIKS